MWKDLTEVVVSPADLVGSWYIVRTNFPMWLKSDHSHPSLHYAPIAGDEHALRDRVSYRKCGAPKEILGIDRQDPEISCHFTWRGSGLLWLLKSEWYVIDLDREAKVAAIFFTKTWFTPEGIDIVARSPSPEPTVVSACIERLEKAARLRRHLAELVEIRHG